MRPRAKQLQKTEISKGTECVGKVIIGIGSVSLNYWHGRVAKQTNMELRNLVIYAQIPGLKIDLGYVESKDRLDYQLSMNISLSPEL